LKVFDGGVFFVCMNVSRVQEL
jgi:hypothetical protein